MTRYVFSAVASSGVYVDFNEIFASTTRLQTIELHNMRGTPVSIDMFAQHFESLGVGEKRTVSASDGFVFYNSESNETFSTIKIKNATGKQRQVSATEKKAVVIEPNQRFEMAASSLRSISGLMMPDAGFSWAQIIEGRISVELNNFENSTFCNDKYNQLESELTELCNRPNFSSLTMKESQHQALQRNLPKNILLRPLSYPNPLEACEKIALVSMVKDEGDVIFYNLSWHYFMGVRKFILIDNGSTDNTWSAVMQFKNLKSLSAKVILITDTRVLYAQASRMNAIIKLAETIFPEVDWIFPNDADEFIVFDESILETIRKIPPNINCIHSPRITYIPSNDYFSMPVEKMFYEKLQVAHKRNPYGYPDDSPWNGKSFIRAHQGLLINKGNHFVSDASITVPTYISGLEVGIHIREYPLRSPEHALRKIVNMGKAHEALRKTYPDIKDFHYADDRYRRYLEVGDAVGREEFKKSMGTGGVYFNEPMPLEEAKKFVIQEDIFAGGYTVDIPCGEMYNIPMARNIYGQSKEDLRVVRDKLTQVARKVYNDPHIGNMYIIPHKTHRMWETDALNPQEVPDDKLDYYFESIKKLPLDWKHYFWCNSPELLPKTIEKMKRSSVPIEICTFTEVIPTMKARHLYEALKAHKLFAIASDVMRYNILRKGGLYSDIGMEFNVDLTPLIDRFEYFWWKSLDYGFLDLSLMAVGPNDKIIEKQLSVIDRLYDLPQQMKELTRTTAAQTAWIGCHHLMAAIDSTATGTERMCFVKNGLLATMHNLNSWGGGGAPGLYGNIGVARSTLDLLSVRPV